MKARILKNAKKTEDHEEQLASVAPPAREAKDRRAREAPPGREAPPTASPGAEEGAGWGGYESGISKF